MVHACAYANHVPREQCLMDAMILAFQEESTHLATCILSTGLRIWKMEAVWIDVPVLVSMRT